METGTSCFTRFDVQRDTLAEYLVSLCTVRSVDTTLAQQVINALDRFDFYMRDRSLEQIEIIDVATRRTIDTLTLSEGDTKVRIRTFRAAPDHSSIILLTDTATKLIDRFEIEPRKLVQVDLATHEVLREVPWPDGEERTGVSMLFSPAGDLLYLSQMFVVPPD